jgi:transcriptional regulator with XRE-family HTH domain
MDISNNIKAIRNEKGIAQAELARRLELDPSSYHRLENRGSKLSIEQAGSIAKALGVSLIELLTWGEQVTDSTSSVDSNHLQKRTDELVDRLKDKDKVIQHIELEFTSLGQSVMIFVWDKIEREAIQEEIGTMTLYYSNPNREIQLQVKEYLESIKSKDVNKMHEGYYRRSVELTESQLKEIFYKELQDEAFRELINHLYLMGYLAQGKLHSAYAEYKKLY